jgi:hypothetical protein
MDKDNIAVGFGYWYYKIVAMIGKKNKYAKLNS